jgi:MYXO-CTERM domain-containing protein
VRQPSSRGRGIAICGLALALFRPAPAEATYSVLAYDRATGTFGGAVASCVPLDTVELVYGATNADATARGAVMTQSYLLAGANENAVEALAEGTTAEDVLSALLDPAYDPSFALRQYAVVDESGAIANFTGPEALRVAQHQSFETGDIVASVQGNILTDAATLELAQQAFIAAEHCGLGERLLRALEAAGANLHGDSRCLVYRKPALSATLALDPREGEPLRLSADTDAETAENPVALLRASFDAAAADACKAPLVEGPGGASGEGGASSGSGQGASGEGAGNASGAGGCAHAPTERSPGWIVALALLVVVWARRRAG